MSNSTISAGNLFRGTSTTTTTFSGQISVEAADGQSAIVGSEFNGDQNGILVCSEISTVK